MRWSAIVDQQDQDGHGKGWNGMELDCARMTVLIPFLQPWTLDRTLPLLHRSSSLVPRALALTLTLAPLMLVLVLILQSSESDLPSPEPSTLERTEHPPHVQSSEMARYVPFSPADSSSRQRWRGGLSTFETFGEHWLTWIAENQPSCRRCYADQGCCRREGLGS